MGTTTLRTAESQDTIDYGIKTHVGDVSPIGPVDGMKWYHSVECTEYIRYDGAWVENGSSHVAATTMTAKPYGLVWNETADTYSRTGDAGFTRIQAKIRRCVLDANGEVKYYLHATNSKLKADGTPSILDGTDGNVMVEVPLTYRKYDYITVGDVLHNNSISSVPLEGYEPDPCFVVGGEVKQYRYYPAYLASILNGKLASASGVYPQVSKTREQFRDLARANGEGWHTLDFLLYEFITMLAIIEYGTMNIQEALGVGRTALTGGAWVGGSYIGINGLSDGYGNGTANNTFAGDADLVDADMSFMSYRGCENFFGNVWRMVDGININDNKVYINRNPNSYADDIFTGDYADIGVTMVAANGYARKLAGSKFGFFPTSVTEGSSAVGTTDYYYQAAGARIALVGSHASALLAAGPLCLAVLYDSGLSNVGVGSGISF